MTRIFLRSFCTSLSLLSLCWGPGATVCQAVSFTVNLDTSSLIGVSGPFSVVFDFFDGDATANNVLTVDAFAFGGGSAGGNPSSVGEVSGDLSSSVTLADTNGSFFNEFTEGFTPGTVLSYLVTTTTNFAGGTPDSFVFWLLDAATGLPVPTLDPLGTDALLAMTLGGSPPTVETFGADTTRTSLELPAPHVAPVSAVPEPGTLVLIGTGLMVALLRQRFWG